MAKLPQMRYCKNGYHNNLSLCSGHGSGVTRTYECLRCGSEIQIIMHRACGREVEGEFSETHVDAAEAYEVRKHTIK